MSTQFEEFVAYYHTSVASVHTIEANYEQSDKVSQRVPCMSVREQCVCFPLLILLPTPLPSPTTTAFTHSTL